MSRRRIDDAANSSESARHEVHVPPGAPSWITADLIAKTLKVWQPYYSQELIPEDALDMILNVGRIVQVLQRGGDDEAVRSAGPSEQP